ncbi:hypothetical protein LPB86_08615 [Pedobacter sp. MC2016-14]|uniref:hypothetical protein n=1 Tax=Pedobacter sp. MC2016-14 TaxID=2897327 RepID=UPI001E5794E1|nr:hypothetical protein [Pedobacter sp. MC2016-14]MCD0488289.1 hypothetical protein [Pedobacter sp. MC2016-14]
MRNLIMLTAALLTATILNVSCNKDRGIKPSIEIDETNLTACPANTNCESLFTEHAQFVPQDGIKKLGVYRLFWASTVSSGMTSTIYVEAPMEGDTFSLGKEDILAGRVKFLQHCQGCNTIGYKPVDGYVKGRNLTPDKRADQTKWLLEIKIILGVEGNTSFTQTMYIKQYFYPNFIYD